MSEALEKFLVLGIPVYLSDDYISWLVSRLHQRIGTHVVTLNSEMVIETERNQLLASIIHKADLVIPDGSGIVFYLWLHNKRQKRCPGIELAESLLREAGKFEEPCPVFFYGGSPGVAKKVADIWQSQVPGLAIAGTQHGFISKDEEKELLQTLKDLQPRLILVGLGVPRQEYWIDEHRHLCPDATWIGIGGSMDIWAGIKSRAPAWLRNNNLEWLYRLYKEPWRWRRMLALPQFALRAVIHRLAGI
ncbi:MAG: WecB/TagA/CpsF family glycosyltransferase [Aphanothece sp. CMT-3BRIN-NPC111]|jgi:N-acetylglucosaminyldiphosphoundecaprenol N-acetyl-beta-D-mannosaminyltransferase|nr:WecB/TagA/CpsF family glycosyltransferase [Aphanothece sp. CMT-3BRIN-NPC111]